MVDPEKQRARYISDDAGAPPVPPQGGYHGARRSTAPTTPPPGAPLPFVAATTDGEEKKRAGAMGWIAIVVASLFAIVLLITMFAGATDAIYGVTLLTLQLVVVGVIIAALCTPRGRRMGAAALAVTLLLNVATVGGMSALQTSASGAYEGQKSEKQKFEEAFPGIKGRSESDVLSQMSLEEVRTESEAAMAEVRERLSAEYGYTWTQTGDEDLRPERNGYGGESMLSQYISTQWMTNEPIQDYDRKIAVMGVIEDVLYDHGMYSMYSFNDEQSYLDDSIKEKFYGSSDPRSQHTWEWYTDNYPDPMRFYAVLYDLSNDANGDLRAEREADVAGTDAPLEGLQIYFLAPELLSEADVDEFSEKMKDYDGF